MILRPGYYRNGFCCWFFALLVLSGCQPAQSTNSTNASSKSLAFLRATSLPLATPEADVVRLASGDWQPYTGQDLPKQGCDSWTIAEAFALEGIRVEYSFMPWARSLRLAEDGALDGTLEWGDTPEFREKFYVSADYLSSQEWVFFYPVNRSFEWHSLDDLAGKRVGVTSGYTYSGAFREIRGRGTVLFEEASSDEANFRKLLAGRIDVFPMERRVGYGMLLRLLPGEERAQITDHSRPITEFRPYLFLSRARPENRERMELFDRGWRQLKESGRYAEIRRACGEKEKE
jgi:polar amino acid transport system substrate-binding protein